MCGTCGCGENSRVRIQKPGEEHSHSHEHQYSHEHSHDHEGHIHSHEHDHLYSHSHSHKGHEHDHQHEDEHAHTHDHGHIHSHEIQLEQDIMLKNNLMGERNRGYFEAKGIKALNLVSSPGSGKTSLLEKSLELIGKERPVYVIEGDQQTMQDAERIKKAGIPVIQVNTGDGCHLDARMVHTATRDLGVEDGSLLFIENVGNLVCPGLFDLGEYKRVVIISVTEGDDKPLKYPTMFRTSHLCIINKTDLLPYVDFDIAKVKEYALRVNHHMEFIEMSVKTGVGIESWLDWLKGL
jgi:hydrogenase nickel incorporation protein HypB